MNAVMKSKTKATTVVEDAGHALRETFDFQGRLRRNPYGMVAGAVGIGFALGGGLFTRLMAGIVRTGLQIGLMAALPVFEKQIAKVITGSKLDTKKENDK
ncbi:MAG TPA: hypothetical protein VF524_15090 [Polyangia bacterium]